MRDFSYLQLQAQLIKTLRGKQSQEQLARRLGVSAAQVIRWENEHAKISWQMFSELCKVTKADLPGALQDVFSYKGPSNSANLILNHIWGDEDYSSVQSKTGFSKAKISRLLNEKGKTAAIDVFKTIEGMAYPLDTFIRYMLADRALPAFFANVGKYDHGLLQMIYQNPWVGALIRYLEVESFKAHHKPSLQRLSEILNVPIKETEKALSNLVRFNHVAVVDGLLKTLNTNLLGQAGREGEYRVRKFWLEKTLAFADVILQQKTRPAHRLVWSYQVLSVSAGAKKEIEEKMLRLFGEIDKIVHKDKEKPDEVLLFHLQFLPVDKLL